MTNSPFPPDEPDTNSELHPPTHGTGESRHAQAQAEHSSTATPRWRWTDRVSPTNRSGSTPPGERQGETSGSQLPADQASATPVQGVEERTVRSAGLPTSEQGRMPYIGQGSPGVSSSVPSRSNSLGSGTDESTVPHFDSASETGDKRTYSPTVASAALRGLAGTRVQNVGPNAIGFQAEKQYFYGGEFVRQQLVQPAELAACTDGRFIEPRDTDNWKNAQRLIKNLGIVILCAEPGTGRRTAALRLLTTAEPSSSPLTIVDLEPEWSKPDAAKLPAVAGHGYLLDLSDIPQQPGPRFGHSLLNYGALGVKESRYLVVLTTPDEWRDAWSEETRHVTVKHSSPDAKSLVEQELRLLGASDRILWLSQDAYADIWQTNPPAQEARRLARIIREAEDSDGRIIEEFRGWSTHINTLLTPSKQGPGEPELVSTRATVWAGALLHGGRKRSVLQAADALLEDLEFSRKPLDVLADATSSNRLKAAALTSQGDRAFHAPDKHDLAPAILKHLWEEFPTQRQLLRNWAVSIVANQAVPDDDARIALSALLRLSKELHDNQIIDTIAREVTSRRLPLAVEALTSAALDPSLGKYVRGRLYRWMVGKPTQAMVELVTQVCGGELAVRQPSIAMTRLARAAVHATFPSESMADAFRRLVEINAAEVTKALEAWLAEDPIKRHALVAFLSLAATDEGTQLLLSVTANPVGRQRFVRAWQQLLQDDESRSATNEHLERWSAAAESGRLPFDLLVDLMADVFEPKIYRSGLQRFFAQDRDFQESFWGKVLQRVIIRAHERERVSGE
ncbi:hypothetical protein SGLAM104S_00466 [Streptomyces glaucescens]